MIRDERMVDSLACPGSLTRPAPGGTLMVVETVAARYRGGDAPTLPASVRTAD